MADNKKTASQQPYESKKVKVFLSKERSGEENSEVVWVNGKSWQIRKGEWVSVPLPVADVLRHREKNMALQQAYVAKTSL